MNFCRHPHDGYLVFGVANTDTALVGVDQEQVEGIIAKLTNLGRDAVEPPLRLDHAVVELDEVPLLFVYICEQANKPAHRRGKSIEESWIRSGGTTRKASRAEIGSLMLHSRAPSWEALRASSLLSANEVVASLDLQASTFFQNALFKPELAMSQYDPYCRRRNMRAAAS